MSKQGYIYMLMSENNAVIYTGVTSNLPERIDQHKQKLIDGFTKKYNVTKLVYYEMVNDIQDAIVREKQIKAGSRFKKLQLIKQNNPIFRDLSHEL